MQSHATHFGICLISQQPGQNIAGILQGPIGNVSLYETVEAILWCQGPGDGCSGQRTTTWHGCTISKEDSVNPMVSVELVGII